MLIDGLKCDKDLTLFKKKRVFSQVLSLLNTDILNHTSKVGQLFSVDYHKWPCVAMTSHQIHVVHVLHAHQPCEGSLSVSVSVCVCVRTCVHACTRICLCMCVCRYTSPCVSMYVRTWYRLLKRLSVWPTWNLQEWTLHKILDCCIYTDNP